MQKAAQMARDLYDIGPCYSAPADMLAFPVALVRLQRERVFPGRKDPA